MYLILYSEFFTIYFLNDAISSELAQYCNISTVHTFTLIGCIILPSASDKTIPLSLLS